MLEAHFGLSKDIRRKASDAMTLDLGIIAAGQLALHHLIASFGTPGNDAAKPGLTESDQSMRMSLGEAKPADLLHTALAEKILG